MSSMQHADDDLLADIATLAHADCARLDSRFERNRVLIHVDVEFRYPRLDTENVDGLCIGLLDIERRQQLAKGAQPKLLDVKIEARLARIGDAGDDRSASGDRSAEAAVLG